jgi:anti-sigma B factor antagonist
MSTASAKMWVLIGEKFACVKISGRANFSSSIDFRTVVTELWQKGYGYFVLDLSECQLMDSTFLGVLAGFGLKMNQAKPDGGNHAIELLNPNARITELLENLGVLHLFRVTQGTAPVAAEGREIECKDPDRVEAKRACLEAHQTLMAINPANAPKFKDLTQFLADDLKKIKTAAP